MAKKQIISQGYDGEYILVHQKTGEPAFVGEKIKSFKGETYKLHSGSAPHKPSASGYANVSPFMGYYAGVFGLEWVKNPSKLRKNPQTLRAKLNSAAMKRAKQINLSRKMETVFTNNDNGVMHNYSVTVSVKGKKYKFTTTAPNEQLAAAIVENEAYDKFGKGQYRIWQQIYATSVKLLDNDLHKNPQTLRVKKSPKMTAAKRNAMFGRENFGDSMDEAIGYRSKIRAIENARRIANKTKKTVAIRKVDGRWIVEQM